MDDKDKLIESFKRALQHNKIWVVFNLGMSEGERFWNPMRAYHGEAFARLKCEELNAKAKEVNTETNSAQWMCQEIEMMRD